MTTKLTKISGIATNTAKELSEAGFDSIESIAEATPESLSKVKGFGAARGTRVISAAKELTKKSISQKETTEKTKEVQETTGGKTETVVAAVAAPVVVSAIKAEDKVEDKAENKVATEKKSTKYWNSTVLHPTAAVVLLAFAVIYFGKIDIADNFNSMINNVQTFVSGSSEQQPESEQETTEIVADQNTDSLIDEVNTAQSIAPQPVNQQQITQVPAWVKEQRKNEHQWVKEQRSQADEFRAIQQARTDEFRAAHKAKAEKQMEESWKRYLASLPPAEAKRVAKQKAEMKLRHGS